MVHDVAQRVQKQFWRESEQAWVSHVLIHHDEIAKPKRWRRRIVTITTEYSDWQED